MLEIVFVARSSHQSQGQLTCWKHLLIEVMQSLNHVIQSNEYRTDRSVSQMGYQLSEHVNSLIALSVGSIDRNSFLSFQ